MIFDLQSLIAKYAADGELIHVDVEVDPCLEAAAIIDRVCKSTDNKALLFNNIKGSTRPLAANLFGSEQRMSSALGVDSLAALTTLMAGKLESCHGEASSDTLRRLVKPTDQAPVASLCQETLAGLDALPLLQCWPNDGGRYITLGQVFTRDPASGRQNCGMYRLQMIDRDTALLRCHPGSGGDAHVKAWSGRKETMPVAVVLGGPPLITWIAGISLPDEIDELDFLAFLFGRLPPLSRCLYSGLLIPATAEIVIEGEIHPGEQRIEGPFGNHTGFYAAAAPAPVFHVKQIRCRTSAVYPCTVVGPPPMENRFMAQAATRLLLPLLQQDNPWVKDLHMPSVSVYHRAAFVAMMPQSESLQTIADRLWQSALLRHARLIVLLDQHCELKNFEQVYWRVINAIPERNQILFNDNRLVIDARAADLKTVVRPDEQVTRRVADRWSELGLDKTSPGFE